MGIYLPNMEMPTKGYRLILIHADGTAQSTDGEMTVAPVPPHGDLIDRDALIKDGWLNLHKEVMRMGGYAIHELPLKNPSIPVIIPAEEGKT